MVIPRSNLSEKRMNEPKCSKCGTIVIKRIITTKGDCVYDCYNCDDQIAESAVILVREDI